MSEIAPRYIPADVEDKRLALWHERKPFRAKAHAHPDKGAYTIVIPPPNVTGVLHMGHALNNTLQDILVRYKRMQGFDVLWMPGTDHAGIATQNVVEKQLAREGISREDLGRDAFMDRLWDWKKRHGNTIIAQLHKLGSSCDWDRTRFTMDEQYSEAVCDVFVTLYERGLIYQGSYIINWCPRCQTALADEEAEHKDAAGSLWHIKYPLKDDAGTYITVATTRPETMLGDTAVAVNPKDARYTGFIGKTIVLPLINREIKIIADSFVDKDFGSGAVKVTPAHDPNDFAMGRRHNLEFVNIMHPDGTMNQNAGAYNGLDRFEARKQVIAALQEQGFLLKVEPHNNAVRRCYRCDTIVEPYLSKQWFVKMKPLADKALQAFQKGDLRIQPKRWEKVYENWLVDIRDWCISRQIWWGHRIPVWYDDCGNYFVAKSEKDAHAQAYAKHGKGVDLRQDPDVLDTWFSSWLWPFATLGWPKPNDDLKYFYPTATLFTAPEIIFFWVARMVMAGIEFMGEVPFKDVVLHGTVRDAKGRKMSKSLGNAIDPLEIIKEYGADALRFSMILNSGQDIYISKEKFEIGRNFTNKLWNASRFVMMNLQPEARIDDFSQIDHAALDSVSLWIISRYQAALADVMKSIEEFRYSDAENTLYEFFWATYCDWYLEMIKGKLDDINIQKTAYLVLKNTLKLLHPFIPFVTEELFSYLHGQETILTLEAWPGIEKQYINDAAEMQTGTIVALLSAIRNIRAEWNIKPNEPVECTIITTEKMHVCVQAAESIIQRLAKVSAVQYVHSAEGIHNSAMGIVGDIRFFIPLGSIIDLTKEKARINNEISVMERSAAAIEGRLSNAGFVQKAPVEVIEKERLRMQELQTNAAALRKTLDLLV